MNKQVAILTYHDSDNFGSVLQAFALNQVLLQNGYDAFIIDYRKPEVERLYRILKLPRTKYELITDVYHLINSLPLKKRKERFEDFRKNYLRLSDRLFRRADELKDVHAEAFICGSDQIWNTGIVDFDITYFLSFVNSGRKISYAASGISSRMPIEALAEIAVGVKNFDAISVREEYAKRQLCNLLDCDVKVALDPVLLMDRKGWESLCVPMGINEDYILCYFAGGVSKEFEEYTKSLAEQLRCKRVILMPEWRNLFRTGVYCYNSGPIEFLSLIKEAKVICTNSFHGTALSIKLNKPFVVGMHVPFSDERIQTLLQMCGLTDREIDTDASATEAVLNIDFTSANHVLADKSAEDIRWLCNAIEGVT